MKKEIDRREALQNIQILDQLLQLYALQEGIAMEARNLLSINKCRILRHFIIYNARSL